LKTSVVVYTENDLLVKRAGTDLARIQFKLALKANIHFNAPRQAVA
jgi:hypothetical protein